MVATFLANFMEANSNRSGKITMLPPIIYQLPEKKRQNGIFCRGISDLLISAQVCAYSFFQLNDCGLTRNKGEAHLYNGSISAIVGMRSMRADYLREHDLNIAAIGVIGYFRPRIPLFPEFPHVLTSKLWER